jgi:hypothetical protein
LTQNKWHPKVQWILTALDIEKQANRQFAMSDIQEGSPSDEI